MTIFPYQKDARGEYFPIISNIKLAYKNKIISLSALLDSEATISVFKPNIASLLGLPLEKGKEIYLGGVGGKIEDVRIALDFAFLIGYKLDNCKKNHIL